MRLALLGLLVSAFFFGIDLRVEETSRITPETNAVVSQRRKGTTATERNRAREAINGIVKKS
jgi:hypothetical protein